MRRATTKLTAQRLREVLDYDPTGGSFHWRVSTSPRVRVGDLAGGRRDGGYVVIRVDGELHRAHALAWLYMTGQMPSLSIDHRDHVRHNNAWANLRQATAEENSQNCRTDGSIGVELRPSGKWRAQLKLHGKKIHIGTYATFTEAKAAYLREKSARHPSWRREMYPSDPL